MIERFCSKCGTKQTVDETRDVAYCMNCGEKLYLGELSAPSGAPQTAPSAAPTPEERRAQVGSPNLFISYATMNPGIGMSVRFEETCEQYAFSHGQKFSFRLSPGYRILVITIGNRAYRKRIFIPSNGGKAVIHCSWDGRARINIEQPMF